MSSTTTQDNERIQMSSGDDFEDISGVDERADKKKINRRITQISKFKNIAQRLTIYNDKYVQVEFKQLTKKGKHKLDLTWLKSAPQKHLKIAWCWLGASAFFGFISAIALNLSFFTNTATIDKNNILIAISLCIASSTVCFCIFLYRSRYLVTYQTWHGKIKLFDLLVNKPNKKEFTAFLDELNHRIEKLHVLVKKDKSQALAKELKEHRRLKDDGTISQDNYEVAKSKIFSQQ